MKLLRDIPVNQLRGTRVLVRGGFDVPLDAKGEVSDTYRIERGVPTLAYLHERGACVIMLNHIGRDPHESNAPVARALAMHLPVHFVPDLLGAEARAQIAAMRDGDILMLENLRSDPRETAGDAGFAAELAALGELYINDAFSAAHRAHASITGIPALLPHAAGLLVEEEVRMLDAMRTPNAPSLAILGGAKFETKAPLVDTLLGSYDHVFITGALANDVFRARKLPVGRSLVSEGVPTEGVLTNPRFLAPIDVTAEDLHAQARVKSPHEVERDDMIVDIGPDTVAMLAPHIAAAQTILWNGPTGFYEHGYTHYTGALAELIATRHAQGARVVIGGGDTAAAIAESGVALGSLGFVSTGGGAMLEYLLEGHLPGMDALA